MITMTTEQRLDRLEREVRQLKRKSPHWTTAKTIMKLTGWDKYRLNRARKNEEIQFKKKNGSIRYDLDTLHESLIKKQIA